MNRAPSRGSWVLFEGSRQDAPQSHSRSSRRTSRYGACSLQPHFWQLKGNRWPKPGVRRVIAAFLCFIERCDMSAWRGGGRGAGVRLVFRAAYLTRVSPITLCRAAVTAKQRFQSRRCFPAHLSACHFLGIRRAVFMFLCRQAH
jgi:hypothetical protein